MFSEGPKLKKFAHNRSFSFSIYQWRLVVQKKKVLLFYFVWFGSKARETLLQIPLNSVREKKTNRIVIFNVLTNHH